MEQQSELLGFIHVLERLGESESPLFQAIEHPSVLFRALRDLDAMIEMDALKRSIIDCVRFLLVQVALEQQEENATQTSDVSDSPSKRRKKSVQRGLGGHMLHTVLSGSPGTGKTTVGRILARIWMSLGFLKRKETTPLPAPPLEVVHAAVQWKIRCDARIEEIENHVDNVRKGADTSLLSLTQIRNGLRHVEEALKESDAPPHIFGNVKREVDRLGKALHRIHNHLPLPVSRDGSEYIESYEGELIDGDADTDLVRIVSRKDFVGGFIGQSAAKTQKILEESLGKVLFIDEAYSLITPDSDRDFGHEVLSTLNMFMSEHPDEIVVIFAGYKDKMEETIFKAQPGLKRRCTWIFEIPSYSEKGIAQIFSKQMKESGWDIDANIDLIDFFRNNLSAFPSFGGDTERLSFFTKLEFARQAFEKTQRGEPLTRCIDRDVLEHSMTRYLENKTDKTDDLPPPEMYM